MRKAESMCLDEAAKLDGIQVSCPRNTNTPPTSTISHPTRRSKRRQDSSEGSIQPPHAKSTPQDLRDARHEIARSSHGRRDLWMHKNSSPHAQGHGVGLMWVSARSSECTKA
ncbi:hypothetical protein DFP72DRAFT_1071231 [Ephemerocybe angulata]|uniref:Uncharacterized protein n=1 Tax=Ephemerocybe angulata TaxID=980116 RepID=A0A8H6HRS3_9AGAR|nr:hypothetical protein DFP72DRAFT_1071231 [Tulosesus angulatus]